MAEQRPNIILVDTDQQRADTVRAAGASWMKTPSLDRLANEGVLFTNSFCCAATCVSSRAAFYSGLYPHTTGQYGFGRFPGQLMWTHRLNEQGYRCFSVGKTHMTTGEHGYEKRIAEWDNKHVCTWADGAERMPCQWLLELQEAGLEPPWNQHEIDPEYPDKLAAFEWPLPTKWHPDAWVGDKAYEWLASEEVPQTEPFFLHVGFMGPHDPYDAPAEYIDLYDDEEIPLPDMNEAEKGDVPDDLRVSVEAMENANNLIAIKESRITRERLTRMRKHYYANVSLIDEKLGNMLDLLEERGLRENTVIIFTSDHGDNLYDHNLVYKGEFYDTVVNVPLLVSGPNVTDGDRKVGDVVSQMDVAQYILDLAGAKRNDLEGYSLRPVLENNGSHSRTFAFAEEGATNHRPEPPLLTMIRSRGYKLVYFGAGREGQLFDLEQDPGEKKNLWHEPELRQTRDELIEELFNWLSMSQYQHRNLPRQLTEGT